MPCSSCQRRNVQATEQRNVSSNATSMNGNQNRGGETVASASPNSSVGVQEGGAIASANSGAIASTNSGAISSAKSGANLGLSTFASRHSAFIDPVNQYSTTALKNSPIPKSVNEEKGENSSSISGGSGSSKLENINSSFDPRDYALGKDAASVEEAKAMMGFITELTEKNFVSTTTAHLTFVKFFVPWCGHCARLAPIWEELARRTDDLNNVKIAEVDCHHSQKICDAQGIDGYPSLVLFKNGKKVEEYAGKRTLKEFLNYINKHNGS